MLDTPPQDKIYRHLHVLNACEESCIMVIMGGGGGGGAVKMSKTEYDLKVILYPAYDTPHKPWNTREKLKYPATQISTQ